MNEQALYRYGAGAARSKAWRAHAGIALAVLCLAGVSACTPIRDYRGFVPRENTLEQIHIGMPRTQVDQTLGTPSAQSAIGSTRYYYISSTFETVAFFDPEEVDRKVYAIEFDETDSVSHIAYYGIQDGKIFDFITRTTPTRGRDMTLVQEFFGNIGRFASDGSLLRDQISRRQY